MNKCIKCGIDVSNLAYRLCNGCYYKFQASNPKDYQLIVNKNTPKDIRTKLDIGSIRSNTIQCRKCHEVIRSMNRHNMVTCVCGECSVDGGSRYSKISFKEKDSFVDMVEYFDE